MKAHRSKLFVIFVTLAVLAACVQAPAAPVPVTPTPVPPTPTPGPVDLAYAFADRFNARDTEGFLSLFTEQPIYSVWSEARGQDGVRWEIAFQTEIQSSMEVSDCRQEGERVKCTIAARDVCIPPEIGALPFESTFFFADGKIKSVSSLVDRDKKSVYHQYDLERWPWQEKNMPEDYAAFRTWGSNGLSATEMGKVIYRLCTGYEAYRAAAASASPAATEATDEAKLTILYDNTATDSSLSSDWGFAALVEYDGHRLLFDTGGNGARLSKNMEKLGVDPQSIEAVIFSHQHDDHTGGLSALLDEGIRPTVYAPSGFTDAFKKRVRDRTKLVEVAEPLTIFPGMHLTKPVGGIIEEALVLETPDGSVVITGCAHPGIVEMVRQAQAVVPGEVALLAGGFHLLETGETQVKAIVTELRDLGVEGVMATHCTGDAATAQFREAYGDKYQEGGVGREVTLATE